MRTTRGFKWKKNLAMFLMLAITFLLRGGPVLADSMDPIIGTANPTIKITKTLESSGEYGEEFVFDFLLEAVAGPGVGAVDMPMPVGASEGKLEISIEGLTQGQLEKSISKEFDFSGSRVGIYEYKLTEITPANPATGVSYSEAEYKIEFLVQNREDGNGVEVKYITVTEIKSEEGQTEEVAGKINNKGEVPFTNKYETGDLKVEKEVTGLMGDKEKDFEFTINIAKVNGINAYNLVKTTASGVSEIIKVPAGADYTFTLKHGETVELSSIPKNTNYTITEMEYDDYTTSYIYQVNNEPENPVKVESLTLAENMKQGNNYVKFTNNKGITPPTGLEMDTLIFGGIIVLGLLGIGFFLIIGRRRKLRDR